jgi:glycine cleavage system H protein
MPHFPSELKYVSSHQWARLEADGTATVGITDHAQETLGDVVFVELPDLNKLVFAGEQVSVVESVKTASDDYSPLSGTVIAVNTALQRQPELVNSEPYDDGWFFKLALESDGAQAFAALLSAEEYTAELGL